MKVSFTGIVRTGKPAYNNHSMDQVIVVFIDRWSLQGSALVQLKWIMNQPTAVSVDRWSLYASGLYDRYYCILGEKAAFGRLHS